MKNKIDPLEELRQEKKMAKLECMDSEVRLAKQWSYLTHNAGGLIFNSALSVVARKLGFGYKELDSPQNKETTSSGLAQNVWNSLLSFSPLIWEIVQPMLLSFAIRKAKSIFSGKKKKKKDE